MRIVRNQWLRALLLTSIYLLGAFGIMASGGGGGSSSIEITDVRIGTREFQYGDSTSSTYGDTIYLSGHISFTARDNREDAQTISVTWRNLATGESGSDQWTVEVSCTFFNLYNLGEYSCFFYGEDGFDFTIPLDIGSNQINVTASMSGSERQASVTVVRLPPLPHVETLPPTEIRATGGTLNGSVNPNEVSAEIWFEYSTNSDLSSSISTPVQTIDADAGDVTVSEAVSNLITDSTYYYRIVATNAYGTGQGSILTLIPVNIPDVITSPAMQLFPRESTLSGSVNPNGFDTDGWFQLGFDPNFAAYDILSPMLPVGSGNTFAPVDHLFDQLSSGTRYYYRLNASNIWGSINGGVLDFTTPLAGDSCWVKKYNPYLGSRTLDNEYIISLEETSDNGYIMIARVYNAAPYLVAWMFIKVNEEGGVEWSRALEYVNLPDPGTYPNYLTPTPVVIKEISSGGYIVVGETYQRAPNGFGRTVAWLTKLDANGHYVWGKFYGYPLGIWSGTSFTDIEVLSDGYIVKDYGSRLLKLDQLGNIQWQYIFDIPSGRIRDIGVVNDGYILVGSTEVINSGNGSDVFVLKLDLNGNIVWQNTYGSVGYESSVVAAISNNGITIASDSGVPAYSTRIPWVLNLSSDGAINWQNKYGNSRPTGIQQTQDGGYVLSSVQGSQYKYIKLDNLGAIEWQKQLTGFDHRPGGGANSFDTIREATGGGYIFAAASSAPGFREMYLVKTDVSGSCPPFDFDTSTVPITTNVNALPSTITSMFSDLVAFTPTTPGNYLVDAYLGIEQIAP